MVVEIIVFVLVVLLQVVQIGIVVILMNGDVGLKWNVGLCDIQLQFFVWMGWLWWVVDNYFEGLILFIIVVVLVVLMDNGSLLIVLCVWLYLLVCIVYVLVYVYGWMLWCLVIWVVGFFLIMIMIVVFLM